MSVSFLLMSCVLLTARLACCQSALGLNINATPTTVEIGVTRYLTVKCLAPKESSSTMESLISLVISRSDGSRDSIFTVLASINVFHVNSQVIHKVKDIKTSEGKIDNNGLSYLTLIWEFPDASKAGVYMCQANGVDFSGHPVSKNNTVTVQSVHPGVDTVMNQIRNLTTQIEQMNIVLHGLENFREMWIDRLQRMKGLVFKSDVFYNGHRYYLSNSHNTIVVNDAAAVCEMFGGYLVELDSMGEFEFLVSFLKSYKEFSVIFTGITDERMENQWINRNAGTIASSYFRFSPDEPEGGRNENCLAFDPYKAFQISDYSCSNAKDVHVSFLCEISVKI